MNGMNLISVMQLDITKIMKPIINHAEVDMGSRHNLNRKVKLFMSSIIGEVFLEGKLDESNNLFFYTMFDESPSFREFTLKTRTYSRLSDKSDFDAMSMVYADLKKIIN